MTLSTQKTQKLGRKKATFNKAVYNRNYYGKNRKRSLKNTKEYYKKHKNKGDDYKLKNIYGINLSDKEKILNSQNYQCKICGKKLGIKFRDNTIDHNHKTNSVRSILCQQCNIGLGNFKDDINLLRKAIKYLKYWEKKGNAK